MASNQNKKMRKANFSHREVMTMLESILENKKTIMSSICSDFSNKDKSNVWKMIAQKVSSLGAATRTSDEVREHFYNLKREHRARASARNKTGNGGIVAKPYDDILDVIVGKDTELVKRVKGGGHDVFKVSQSSACSESVLCETITEHSGNNTVTLMDTFLSQSKGITDIRPVFYSTPRRGCAGPHIKDCLAASFSAPESPEACQIVEVQPLNDLDEAQIPPCQAPVEPPHQQKNEPAKDKAKQDRPKQQQPLKKKLKKRQSTGNEETPYVVCIFEVLYYTEQI